MAEQIAKQDQAIILTRRQALTALGLGAVTLTATHLGVAYEAGQLAEQQPQQTADSLAAELEKLKGLLALYEGLDRIGLDAIAAAALPAFKGFLDTLRGGVSLLREGVTATEGTIRGFQGTFATLRAGLKTAEDAIDNVAGLLKNAENWLGQATSPAQPLLEKVRQFFDDLLSKIPFGIGDSIRTTIDGLTNLVGAVPDMMQAVGTSLLEPLRTGWFSDDSARNIQGTLLDPITQKLLDPLNQFLANVDQTLLHWESDVSTPIQAAINQRAAVRRQIADYKQQHGLS